MPINFTFFSARLANVFLIDGIDETDRSSEPELSLLNMFFCSLYFLFLDSANLERAELFSPGFKYL